MPVKIFDTHALTPCVSFNTKNGRRRQTVTALEHKICRRPRPCPPNASTSTLISSLPPQQRVPPRPPRCPWLLLCCCSTAFHCIALWRSCPSPPQLLPLCLRQSLPSQPYALALEVSNQVRKGLVIASRQPCWGGGGKRPREMTLVNEGRFFWSLAVAAVFPSLLGGGGVAAGHSPLLLVSRHQEAEIACREAEAAVKRTRGGGGRC